MATKNNEFCPLNKWFSKLGNSDFSKHFLLVCLLFILIIIGVIIFIHIAEDNVRLWSHHDLNFEWSADTAMAQFSRLKFSNSIKKPDSSEINRLREQYGETRNRARLHAKVMVYFYSRYYMAITMATLLGLIASIVFLFVSRTGWASANSYVLTILIVTATSAAFFGLFPLLFKQQQNMEANKKLYISHKALENRILSYVATGKDLDTTQTKMSNFIKTIDSLLVNFHNYPIELDPSVIPDPAEIFQGIKGINGG